MGYAPLLMPGCHDSGPCSLVCGFTFEFYFWILLCMTFAKQVFGRMPWLSEVRTLVGKLEPQQLESPDLSTLPSAAADPRHGPGPIRLLCYAVAGLLGHRRDPTNGCCDRSCCCWRLLWPAWRLAAPAAPAARRCKRRPCSAGCKQAQASSSVTEQEGCHCQWAPAAVESSRVGCPWEVNSSGVAMWRPRPVIITAIGAFGEAAGL